MVNLVRSTSRDIVDHSVCVISSADFFGPSIREAGYKVQELGILSKRPFFQAAKRFRKVLRQEKPDIIHSWLYDANVSARLATLPGRAIPIVTSLQLADYEPEAARIGNWNPHKVRGLKFIDKITALLTNPYFVPCSQFVKNSYIRNYGITESRTQVIYNSADPTGLTASEDSSEELQRELNLPADSFIYLNVGRLDPQKNHKVMFKAFKEVLLEISNARLLLAGVGGMETELKELTVTLGINASVLFLGRRSDVGALLELADVFVFPSFFEGLGVAMVEAMFKSLPCIASRIEVFEEVFSDRKNGLLIDPHSPVELKDAMILLYKDEPMRKSLGAEAFQTAVEKFEAAKTAKQWEELYTNISAGSRNSLSRANVL